MLAITKDCVSSAHRRAVFTDVTLLVRVTHPQEGHRLYPITRFFPTLSSFSRDWLPPDYVFTPPRQRFSFSFLEYLQR